MTKEKYQNSIELTEIWDTHSQYPTTAIDKNDRVFVCWQEYKDGHDQIVAGFLENDQIHEKTILSGKGEALKPSVCFANDQFGLYGANA